MYILAAVLNWWYIYFDPAIRAAMTRTIPADKVGKAVIIDHYDR